LKHISPLCPRIMFVYMRCQRRMASHVKGIDLRSEFMLPNSCHIILQTQIQNFNRNSLSQLFPYFLSQPNAFPTAIFALGGLGGRSAGWLSRSLLCPPPTTPVSCAPTAPKPPVCCVFVLGCISIAVCVGLSFDAPGGGM
jgi:hypothetical protein